MEASSCKSGGAFVILLLKAIYDALCQIANTEQVIEQVTEQVIEQVTEQVDRLLAVICGQGYSMKGLMELEWISKWFQKHLKDMPNDWTKIFRYYQHMQKPYMLKSGLELTWRCCYEKRNAA